jgi:hypothetical protein
LLDRKAVVGWIERRDRLAGAHGLAFVGRDHHDLSRHFERDVDAGVRLDDAARCRGPRARGTRDGLGDDRDGDAIYVVRRARIGARAAGRRERADRSERQDESRVERE